MNKSKSKLRITYTGESSPLGWAAIGQILFQLDANQVKYSKCFFLSLYLIWLQYISFRSLFFSSTAWKSRVRNDNFCTLQICLYGFADQSARILYLERLPGILRLGGDLLSQLERENNNSHHFMYQRNTILTQTRLCLQRRLSREKHPLLLIITPHWYHRYPIIFRG